jgi:hypothetical protein
MDIHKPKPWHSWREFLKEYLIIVVGVLTALGAEQGVEWLHWRHEVAVAREAIAFDLRRLVGGAAVTDVQSACVGARLVEMADVLDQAEVTHRLPPLGFGGIPQVPNWSLRSWTAVTSGQTLAHIPNREQLMLTGIASYAEELRTAALDERQQWAVLQSAVGPGRAISDAEIAALRSALARAYNDALTAKTAHQMSTLIVRSGYLTRRQLDASFEEGVRRTKVTDMCQPRRPPPARSSDLFHQLWLFSPVRRPGEAPYGGSLGVGGALTTER